MDNTSELIEKYIRGQLTSEEEEAFNQRMGTDEEFRQLVEDAKSQIEDLDNQGIAPDDGSETMHKGHVPVVLRALIILVGFIIVAILVFKFVKSDEPVALAHEEKMTALTEESGGVKVGDGTVINLDRMYKKIDAGEDLSGSIDSLKIVLNDSHADVRASVETKLYLAKAYIKQSEYASAMPLLQEVIASGDPDLIGEAQLLYYKIHTKV